MGHLLNFNISWRNLNPTNALKFNAKFSRSPQFFERWLVSRSIFHAFSSFQWLQDFYFFFWYHQKSLFHTWDSELGHQHHDTSERYATNSKIDKECFNCFIMPLKITQRWNWYTTGFNYISEMDRNLLNDNQI